MKIKILTFHRELNYGANLQAYALRTYLVRKGHDVEFIDYHRSSSHSFFSQLVRGWIGKTPLATVRKIKRQFEKVSYERKCRPIFESFQRDHLPATSIYYNSVTSLKENPPVADCYIVGSDQVWSPKIVSSLDLPAYFLDFKLKSVRKISYAASSGGEDFSVSLLSKIQPLLADFHSIGVREGGLLRHLKDTLKRDDVFWNPDPTFLIDWRSEFNLTDSIRTVDLGLFVLNRNNLNKIDVGFSGAYKTIEISGRTIVNFSHMELSPQQWIKQISDCKVLITDSYHAVLFALYTQTPFFFVKWGLGNNRDKRISDLLKKLEISDCIVENVNFSSLETPACKNIDWLKLSRDIQDLRDAGEAFLDECLKN